MIKNLWNDISVFCGCHEEDVPLSPHEGSAHTAQGGKEASLFFSCPKYYSENREPGERPCMNRLSIEEYEEAVLRISSILEEADETRTVVNLSGMRWKNTRGTEFYISFHDSVSGIGIRVINRKTKG